MITGEVWELWRSMEDYWQIKPQSSRGLFVCLYWEIISKACVCRKLTWRGNWNHASDKKKKGKNPKNFEKLSHPWNMARKTNTPSILTFLFFRQSKAVSPLLRCPWETPPFPSFVLQKNSAFLFSLCIFISFSPSFQNKPKEAFRTFP